MSMIWLNKWRWAFLSGRGEEWQGRMDSAGWWWRIGLAGECKQLEPEARARNGERKAGGLAQSLLPPHGAEHCSCRPEGGAGSLLSRKHLASFALATATGWSVEGAWRHEAGGICGEPTPVPCFRCSTESSLLHNVRVVEKLCWHYKFCFIANI